MKLFPNSIYKLGAAMWMTYAISMCGADYQIQSSERKVPDQVAAAIAETMKPIVYEISKDEDLLFRFWFRDGIPLSAKPESPEKALDVFVQPALMGVVEVIEEGQDYREDELFKNVFTLRYGLRPNDGNHLGSSDYRHFAVLIPSSQDQKVDGIDGYKALVKASSLDTISDHPVILSLRPSAGNVRDQPSIQEPAHKHHALRVEVNGKEENGDNKKLSIVFDIVFEGFAEF